MCRFVIQGNNRLSGDVNISSAKNAVLPILASTILTSGVTVIKNAPMLEDVKVLCEVLGSISAEVNIDTDKNEIAIDTRNLHENEIDNELVKRMRASFLVIGPLVARFGKAKVSLPGGCRIGARPIDLHLKGLKKMGAEVREEKGYVEVTADKLKGNSIFLDFPSVGATENLMMSATLAEGTTYILNAAKEPEVVDLANFLIKMGAYIKGAGTSKVEIRGGKPLKCVKYTPMFDRIEAGTFMIAAAITRGNININGVVEEDLMPIIEKLREIGVGINIKHGIMNVNGDVELKATDITTMPHPGFPTDMQAQIMSLLALVEGNSSIKETIFENRFMHIQELRRMGADITIDSRTALINGVPRLTGSNVTATDLRAGAGLILAALAAEGSSSINEIYNIDRGYVSIEKKLSDLGAVIIRE